MTMDIALDTCPVHQGEPWWAFWLNAYRMCAILWQLGQYKGLVSFVFNRRCCAGLDVAMTPFLVFKLAI